jgi:uncharacterized protein with PIN domain
MLSHMVRLEATQKFAADRMLARLARWLRLLGADTIFDPLIDGAAMLKRARAESRVMLTRDKRLRTSPAAVFLESDDFREQLRQVLARHPFDFRAHVLTRCSRCNSLLNEVSPQAVQTRVPPYVFASAEKFSVCPGCAQIYWSATHRDRIIAELRAIGLDLKVELR